MADQDIIISSEPDLNIEQTADAREIQELDQGLQPEGGGEDTTARGAEEGAEEVDLDELEEEERTGRVDTELQEAHTQEERDRIKADRKQRQLDRRARARQRVESLQREVANERQQRLQVERRLLQLESHQSGVQLGQIEEAEQRADQAIAQLEGIIADATVKADGQTVARATTRLQEALLYKRDVAAAKEAFVQRSRTPQNPSVDPEMVRRSKAWAAKNPWYRGPQSNDTDSVVLTGIDNSLARDGFNPNTDAYWEEMEARVKKYLPHRAQGRAMPNNSEDNSGNNGAATPSARKPAAQPRQAVAGAGNNGNGSSGGGRKFILSGERVKAMKESGAWEDPVRKADQIRRYREWDAANGR